MADTGQRKLRQYQGLWLEIAKADLDKPVSIRCHGSFVRCLIQAVRKEKSIANVMRKNLDMPRYGELVCTVVEDKQDKKFRKITFTLAYNGDHL
jgi:hypothetical protein